MDIINSALDGLFVLVPRRKAAFVRAVAVVVAVLFWVGDRSTAVALMTWLTTWVGSDARVVLDVGIAQVRHVLARTQPGPTGTSG